MKILLIILALVGGYLIWNGWSNNIIAWFQGPASQVAASPAPAPQAPKAQGTPIVVYGRDGCSLTREFRDGLSNAGADYVFKNIDEKNVMDELVPLMKNAGLETSSFGLPVVDVNGSMFIRPELNNVLQLYGKPPTRAALPQSGPACPVAPDPPAEDPLKVSGIVMGDPSMAIVGGQALMVGEKVGRYKIMAIGTDSVKYRGPGGKIVIKKISKEDEN